MTVGRFAPSPTGELHIGSLIAALASWCDARARGGRWLLRIDDIDPSREVAGTAERFATVLATFGLVPDPPVVWQSERLARYRAALRRLNRAGRLYRCDCTRRSLAGERRYTGRCRDRGGDTERAAIERLIESPEPHDRALRVRLDDMAFVDRRFGTVRDDADRGVADVVVRRKDGFVAYHLACAVDDSPDASLAVTDVVRGADLLESSLPQNAIRDALGIGSPRFLHVPVATHASGDKFSKRTLAPIVEDRPPLGLLKACWAFLGQRPIDAGTPTVFLATAATAWDPMRVPAVRTREWCESA